MWIFQRLIQTAVLCPENISLGKIESENPIPFYGDFDPAVFSFQHFFENPDKATLTLGEPQKAALKPPSNNCSINSAGRYSCFKQR